MAVALAHAVAGEDAEKTTPEKIQFYTSSTTEAERLTMLRSGDGRVFEEAGKR